MLRAFLGPLAVTFPVALFILDMQFLWVYADDLMGKGLDFWIVFKLFDVRFCSVGQPGSSIGCARGIHHGAWKLG